MTGKTKRKIVVRRATKDDRVALGYTHVTFAQDREVANRFFDAAKVSFPKTPTQYRMQSSRG